MTLGVSQPFMFAGLTTPEQELLVKYFLSRIVEPKEDTESKQSNAHVSQRRLDEGSSSPTIVYPQVRQYLSTTVLNNIQILIFLYPGHFPHKLSESCCLSFTERNTTSGKVAGEGQTKH